jgi:hypothetical protein
MRFLLTRLAAELKTLSAGAEVAGMQRYCLAISQTCGNSLTWMLHHCKGHELWLSFEYKGQPGATLYFSTSQRTEFARISAGI